MRFVNSRWSVKLPYNKVLRKCVRFDGGSFCRRSVPLPFTITLFDLAEEYLVHYTRDLVIKGFVMSEFHALCPYVGDLYLSHGYFEG